TAFTFEIRVVTCNSCGAPIAVGEAGGRLDCGHCGGAQQTEAGSRAVTRSPPVPEPERLEGLRRADRGSVRPPKAVEDMFAGLELLPWKMGAALATWKTTRAAASAGGDYQTERLLHRLSVALADHFTTEGDALRARSLLEAALDATREAVFRQMLCGALCRCACAVGDLRAAESWLALCDPASGELMADTAYRLGRATIDTAYKRYDAGLGVLGNAPGSVPFYNEYEGVCAALQANAFEKLGRVDLAVSVLDAFNQNSSAFDRLLCAQYLSQNAASQLCAQSAPQADALQRARGIRVAGKTAGAAGFALVSTIVSFGLGLGVGAILALFGLFGAGHFSVGLGGLLGCVFGTIGVVDYRKSAHARRLRSSGVPAAARIVHARGTGLHTMGVPQLLYRVLVLPREGAPFLAHSMFHADASDRARFTPGALVVVRMDPERRGSVQIELD
nr:hypothetical protein [Polyangiaceae bacterium]